MFRGATSGIRPGNECSEQRSRPAGELNSEYSKKGRAGWGTKFCIFRNLQGNRPGKECSDQRSTAGRGTKFSIIKRAAGQSAGEQVLGTTFPGRPENEKSNIPKVRPGIWTGNECSEQRAPASRGTRSKYSASGRGPKFQIFRGANGRAIGWGTNIRSNVPRPTGNEIQNIPTGRASRRTKSRIFRERPGLRNAARSLRNLDPLRRSEPAE